MQRNDRFRLVLIVALVVASISAGIGRAGEASDSPDETRTCGPTDVVDGNAVDDGESKEVESEDCGNDATEADHVDESEPVEESEPSTEEIDPERAAACEDAATPDDEEGTEEGTGGAEESKEPTKLTGLENASAHVLENCMKNENVPGVITALEHLAENMERKADHDAWLEEKEAEREAAKAEREVAREAAKAAREAARASR